MAAYIDVVGCGVCNHPKRVSIDTDLAAGKSIADVAAKYVLSVRSLGKHADSHDRLTGSVGRVSGGKAEPSAAPVVPAPAPRVERVAKPASASRARGGSTLDGIDRHLDEIEELLEVAKNEGDNAAIEKLLAERGRTHGRRARLTGEAINEAKLVRSARFKSALAAIVDAVRPHPDAAKALHETFRVLRLEEQATE